MRKLLSSGDPELAPSSQHTAHALMTNITAREWTYNAELYLVKAGTKYTSSETITFPLAAGASQTIDFPITMPAAEGVYEVYLDISAEGVFIRGYIATEDVTVVSVVPKTWECPVCGAMFATFTDLVTHINATCRDGFSVGTSLSRPGGWENTRDITLCAGSNVSCRYVFWLEKPDGTGWKVGQRTSYSTAEYCVTLYDLPLGDYQFNAFGISPANKVAIGWGLFSSY